MEYGDIIKDVTSGNYAPVYFLQGDEPFFIDNIIAHIEKDALDETQKSFNQHVLYGKEVDMSQIMTTAKQFPMMGDRQVVIVKEAQEIRGWTKELNQNLLIDYLNNPLASTILAFSYKYKSLDKRTKIGKELEKKSVFLHSKKIYDNQVPNWIMNYARARKVEISNKAVMLLSENIGNNLQRLSNEIEKLLLNLKQGEIIDEVAIHRFVGISKEYNIFELQSALSAGNQKKAQQIVKFFASNPSNNPLVLTIFNLFSYFNKLLLAHGSAQKDKQTIARVIGVHPFFAEEYIRALRHYSLPVVLRNIQYIRDADLASKGVGQLVPAEEDLLKELIFKLMN